VLEEDKCYLREEKSRQGTMSTEVGKGFILGKMVKQDFTNS
jgi:hypothetical protein